MVVSLVSEEYVRNGHVRNPRPNTECLKTAHHRTSQIYGHNCTAHHLDRTAHHSV